MSDALSALRLANRDARAMLSSMAPRELVTASLYGGKVEIDVDRLRAGSPAPKSSTKTVCAFTRLRPETAKALEAQAERVEYVDVSGSETSYWELLRGLWDEQETFVLVEHDCILAPGTLRAFDDCDSTWCCCKGTSEYPRIPNLQVNRFDRSFLQLHPEAVRRIKPCNRHWLHLDGHLLRRPTGPLRPSRPHLHRDKPIEHLNATPDNGKRWINWIHWMRDIDAAEAEREAKRCIPGVEQALTMRGIPLPPAERASAITYFVKISRRLDDSDKTNQRLAQALDEQLAAVAIPGWSQDAEARAHCEAAAAIVEQEGLLPLAGAIRRAIDDGEPGRKRLVQSLSEIWPERIHSS